MATLKLTDGLVEAIEPGNADTYVWDTALPRFGLRVTPAGARIYLVQYRAKTLHGGATKTRRITIGKHDGDLWNVTKARAAARKLLAPVDLGQDPFADREEELEARRLAAEAKIQESLAAEQRLRDNFKAVAERYIELRAKRNRSWAETERLLRHGPIPAWKHLHIGDVRRPDVADLMDAIAKRSPAVARATYAALRGLFAWCIERDLLENSPCTGLTAPPRPQARDRVLSDEELRRTWVACGKLGYPFGPLIQLLITTGQRRSEVAGMTWAEVDLEDGLWRIPAGRTKNAKAHEVDLSPQALTVLKTLPRSGTHLFPARHAPKRTQAAGHKGAVSDGGVRGFSATKRRLDELIETERACEMAEAPAGEVVEAHPWRLHDLRRTAATGMAGLGFPPHIVERVLNHISGSQSGLVGVYQRHEYRAERKAAIVAWGGYLEAVLAKKPMPSNVRALRPGRAKTSAATG